MKQKKISTIEDLAVMMKEGFERSDKNTDKKIENLATMMQGEFLAIHERFDDLESEIKQVKRDMEDLKLRMTEVAFKFEIRDLEKRVKKLELRLAK